MTFEISVGISFLSLLLFPEHDDIQNVSYTAQFLLPDIYLGM